MAFGGWPLYGDLSSNVKFETCWLLGDDTCLFVGEVRRSGEILPLVRISVRKIFYSFIYSKSQEMYILKYALVDIFKVICQIIIFTQTWEIKIMFPMISAAFCGLIHFACATTQWHIKLNVEWKLILNDKNYPNHTQFTV